MSGTHLKLEGMGAFDAAVHCASVAAAERQQKVKKSYSTGNLGSTPALAGGSDAATGQQMARSASNNSIPAASLAASATAAAAAGTNAASPTAAGLSAAQAAQDRRRRFQDGQRQQQQSAAPAGQQRGHAAGRSRSFTVGTTPTVRSTGVEPPAAFRNILASVLGGSTGSAVTASGSNTSPFAAPAAQIGAAPEGPAGAADGAAAAAQAPVRSSSPAAAATLSPSPIAGSAAEQQRLKKGRLSLRNITELTDVPEIDETVAVGSFSGKFRLHLKAFSRKVARSLSFTNKSCVSPREGAGSSSSAAAVAADGFGGLSSSNNSSRAASMSSPCVINYGGSPAVGPSPRSMTSSPLPPLSPSPVRAI